MIKNYLKIALRNLKRNPSFSIINILGLTLGMAIGMLIMVYVINELTYDQFHNDYKQIYRINAKLNLTDRELNLAATSAPFGPFIKANYPKVKSFVRFTQADGINFEYQGNKFYESIRYCDQGFFDVFTVSVLKGDYKNALVEPFSLVITEPIAKKLFGDENPIGKVIRADNDHNYTIKCVIEPFPENSHIKYDILASFNSLNNLPIYGPPLDSWLGFNYPTYFKLENEYRPKELEAALPQVVENYIYADPIASQFEMKIEISLEPIQKIHLYSKVDGDDADKGSLSNVMIFALIGFFVLLIACVNFMNLSTARSSVRLKEVGMRKVLGALRPQLIRQFMVESLILTLISLILAATIAELLLPEFNAIIQKNLSIDYLRNWNISLGFILMALLVGLIAGSYPAFYISSFKPIAVLKGKPNIGIGNPLFRNFLVVFQFIITIALISSSGVVFRQLGYIRNTDVGFDMEQVYIVPLRGSNIRKSLQSFKNEIASIPDVNELSLASGYPGYGSNEILFQFEDYEIEEGVILPFYDVDYHFFDLLKIKLSQGRFFSPENALDKQGIIINEALVKKLAWNDPIGKTVVMTDMIDDKFVELKYAVLGVVKDFNYESLHSTIRPIIMRLGESGYNYLITKLTPSNLSSTINKIEEKYKEYESERPFAGFFLNDRIASHYEADNKLGKIFVYFSILAIFIASLGLFGLASFMMAQRSKEIGIRKILGSSVGEIISQTTFRFLKLVLFSTVIAIPLSWYFMDQWLQSFEYKVNISWWIFALATLIAMTIAFVTILSQSVKAATANPVDAIKYE